MSGSWFNNIKGNLSSVASNVSSFTKEVLQDAVTESFEDIHTGSEYQQNTSAVGGYEPPEDPLQHISYLQIEIQNLSNDIAFKDEQILFLQSENESFRQNENHCENLKEVLLEKEKEIELSAQKIQETEMLYQEHIRKLEERNAETLKNLETKCTEVGNKSDDNIDTGWTDDWGLGNDATQDIHDLTFKNECLANDLAFKEILINSIESKIFEISDRKVEASNFNEWIDGILNEKVNENSLISENNTDMHSTELCSVLDKYIVKPEDLPTEDYAYHIDERLGQIIEEYVKLEKENIEYRNVISNIEHSISKCDEGYDNFKIKDFKEWLDNVGAGENYIVYNDPNKDILEKIQTEIRDIDEEYEDFKIENFSTWLEKMQCRIDDLEMEIINEQESRDAEEKHRIVERETLNDLFNQKLNEISLLKVELYNYKTHSSHSLNPIVEVEQEELMTVHEQLNEATARCEALQTELATVQQPGETSEFQLRIKELSTDNDRLRSQLSDVESSNENMESQLEDLQQKYDALYDGNGKKEGKLQELQLQVENFSAIYDCIKEQLVTSESSKESIQVELNEYIIKYDSISSEVQTLNADLKESTNRYELLQAAETVSDSLQLQLNDLSADKDQLKEQLEFSESIRENLSTDFNELKIKYDTKCFEFDEVSDSCGQMKTQIDIINNDYNTLKTVKGELVAEFDKISKENNELKECMDLCKNAENELQDIKTEYNLLKLVQLQSEEEKERLNQHTTTLSEANVNLSYQNDQITADMTNMMADMTTMGTLLHSMTNGNFQYDNVDVSLSRNESLVMFASIKDLAAKYTSLENQYNDISEKYVAENQNKDSMMGEHEDLHNIIVYILKSIDDILPDDMKGCIVVDNKLTTTEFSRYVSNMKCLADHIECVENTLKQKIEDTSNLLEIEKSDKNNYLSQIDILNLSIENYKSSIEKFEKLAEQPNDDLDNLLQVERATNEQYCVEIDKLNKTIIEYKSEIEQLKVAKNKAGSNDDGESGAGGGLKFGAIKRKIKGLELANQNLIKENEELKSNTGGYVDGAASELKQLQSMLSDKNQECECYAEECKLLKSSLIEMQENMASYSSNSVTSLQHQEQLHNLSLMLTEKNEAIEKFQQENEHLKSKLLEVENEISDLELIREECKQLKAMLVGKEHQNKIDDTITTLQTESKQLKHLLAAKDSEVQYMQSQILEKENELSNMELIQEECKQLKQMLIVKGEESGQNTSSIDSAELEAKNAEIIELRNSTSDMELLREECKQLKQMLLSNSATVNASASNDNSSDVSIQLLEAMLEDRDVQIAQQNGVIAELQSKTSDMNLIQEECKMLKTMLASQQEESVMVNSPSADVTLNTTEEFVESSFVQQVKQLEDFLKEKEEGLKEKEREVEILNARIRDAENGLSDLDLIRNECKMLKEMLKEKEQFFIEIQDDLDNANTVLQQKNNELKTKESSYGELEQRYKTALDNKELEILRLQEEVTVSIEQDENLHILQTEYRNVDENLKMTQNELYEVKQILERTDSELIKTKQTLVETEDECERLKVTAEQSSQLNVSLLQKDREMSNTKKDIEGLQSENASLIKMCDDKEYSIKGIEEQYSNLDNKLKENMDLAANLKEKIIASESIISKNTSTITDQLNQINKLAAQLEKEEAQNINLETTLTENGITMKGKEAQINKLQVLIDNFVTETKEKTNRMSQLESELSRSKEYQMQLVENIKSYSDKEKETLICKTCEYNDNEQKMMKTILENIEKMLKISGQQLQIQDRTYSIIEQLSFVEACLQNILAKISEKELEISNLNNNRNEMKLKFEQNLNEKLSQLHIVLKELEDRKTSSVTLKNTYDLQMKDLQSQLVESSEIGTLYQKKCAEYIELQDQLFREQKIYKEHKTEFERVGNSKKNEELEVLRTEMERNAHLYLGKNKECDSLKLEMLQLEETVYNLKSNLQTMKVYEGTAKQIPTLQQNIGEKDQEINKLKSLLEDNELKLQGSKKEKQFLDDLVREKELSDKEKEQLKFQIEQNDRLIQEKEVLIRHRDVTLREMEAKTKRELERLRNHMIMTEEAHTKDILELQEKEEALQEELEDAKQGLSKKSIILQDSSKQFQEHCVDLEEQLHKISSQRDTSILELSRCQEKIIEDGTSIYNLQNALEQLEKEKIEQSDYLTSFAKRKAIEYESRIDELTEDLNKTQGAMSEAALAVQGINKLNLELQQKENELKVSKEKMNELLAHVRQLEDEHEKILEAADHKLDKSLLRNLFMKYFQSPNDKRSDILHVIGGLLGWSPDEIQQIGSGAAPSKVGGWITSVWSYGSPKKTSNTPPKTPTTPIYDSNKSLSELFVKFLENETANNTPVDTTSLTLNETAPNVPMFVTPQTTPDILTFHNHGPDQRIPAPGQEIPRVHTHHAQSTLKSILTSAGPY